MDRNSDHTTVSMVLPFLPGLISCKTKNCGSCKNLQHNCSFVQPQQRKRNNRRIKIVPFDKARAFLCTYS